MMAPVSVCHQVSTIGHRPFPISRWYHIHASGLIGSPAPDGGWFIYPEGDTSVPPSAWMPKDTYFFDSTNRQPPLDESKLDPADNCEEMGVISAADVQHYARLARHYHETTNYGIYMTLPGTAFGDIALVPAPWM